MKFAPAKIALLACAMVVQCHVTLDSCNIQCGSGVDDEGSTSVANIRRPVGKKGPAGSKGEPGESCECQDLSELIRKIEELQRVISSRSCEDVQARYESDTGGVYTIYPFPGGRAGLEVYCDLTTDGGGWLVFQKRIDGSEDFYRYWEDYVRGFGKLDGEFWLGLEPLHELTKNNEYELRVDMEDFEGNTRYASYSTFVVGEGTNYALNVSGYSGTAGSAMRSSRFSTRDRDQDTWPNHCAQSFKAGWWYTACHVTNPNGLYHRGNHTSFADGVNWRPWRGYHYSLKRIEMKLRRK